LIIFLSISVTFFIVCLLGLPFLDQTPEVTTIPKAEPDQNELIASELEHELLTGKIDQLEYEAAKRELY
jgi:hypothetical protein